MTLYSEDVGSGEPVLLLHGGFCSLESLRPISDELSDYRRIAFERPGHGRSADIEGEYDYEQGVADALAYLDSLGVASAHVVGYSDGAIIGLLLARDHPSRVTSLVAISGNLDPSGFTHSDESAGIPVLAPLESTDEGDERMHYERLSPDGPAHADVVLGKLFRLWTTQPDIDPASLARISAPALIVSGDRDSIRPDHSVLIAASIPRANLCIVPGATHGLVSTHARFLASLIRDFLAAT
jgi:pimeloyl-ACP methyl ester carboxylesterase